MWAWPPDPWVTLGDLIAEDEAFEEAKRREDEEKEHSDVEWSRPSVITRYKEISG